MSFYEAASEDLGRGLDGQNGERTGRLTVAALVSSVAAACSAQALATGAGDQAWQVALVAGTLVSVVLTSMLWSSLSPGDTDESARARTGLASGWSREEFAQNLLAYRIALYERNRAKIERSYRIAAIYVGAVTVGLVTILLGLVVMATWVVQH